MFARADLLIRIRPFANIIRIEWRAQKHTETHKPKMKYTSKKAINIEEKENFEVRRVRDTPNKPAKSNRRFQAQALIR